MPGDRRRCGIRGSAAAPTSRIDAQAIWGLRAGRCPADRVEVALLGLLVLALLSGCAGDGQPDPPDTGGGGGDGSCPDDLPTEAACVSGAPSYALTVGPIFERRCVTCHYSGNRQSTLALENYAEIYPARVTAMTRLYACRMPPVGAPSLTPEERRMLLEWFVCGAPEN